MSNDEQTVRRWFDQWIEATTVGDLDLALSLIADDAVFLIPGAGEMDKGTYAAGATATDPNYDFKLDSSVQAIEIMGDRAWVQAKHHLVTTKLANGEKSTMAGHALSVLRREGDGWVLFRDASTVVAAP